MLIPNLLIIAGTGNKSGKTTMACRIIEQFKHLKIVSVKVTRHFHEITPGLVLISEKPGFSVYEESSRETQKDTSRMLRAGASRVLFAKVTDNSLSEAFAEILKHVPQGEPIICESPALRHYAEPGIFIIMTSSLKVNQKNIKSLLNLPHVEFNLDHLSGDKEIPVSFSSGKWSSR
jgi:endonuclease IV